MSVREHLVEIAWAYGPDAHNNMRGQELWTATYNGEDLGRFKLPECDVARLLLERGLADARDTLITMTAGSRRMTGRVGWLAKKAIHENDKVGGPYWRKYQPFSREDVVRPEAIAARAEARAAKKQKTRPASS